MAEISAELALEIKEFLSGIRKAQQSANSFAGKGKEGASGWSASLSKVAGGIATVAAAALKAAAVIAGIGATVATGLAVGLKKAFDLGGKLSDIATQVGSTAGRVQVLGAAFENNGLSIENMANSVNRMQRSIVEAAEKGGTAAEAFKAIGLDPEELLTGDPLDTFMKVAEAFKQIDNATEQTGRAMQIFGRSGAALRVLLKDDKALENASRLIGGQAAIFDEHAGNFDRAADVLAQTGTKFTGFFVGVGSQIIEQILPAIEFINDLDLTGIGKRFGESLSQALDVAVGIFNTFRNMNLREIAGLFGQALKLGIFEAVNILYKGIAAIGSAFIAYQIGAAKAFLEIFQHLKTKAFWSGLLNALIGIGLLFGSVVAKQLANTVEALKNSLGVAGEALIGDLGDKLDATAQVSQQEGKNLMSEAGKDLAPTLDTLATQLREAGANVAQSFVGTYQDGHDILDTTEATNVLDQFARKIAQSTGAARNTRLAKAAENAQGTSEDGEGAAVNDGLPKINSRLAGAINTITGRSANAVIAAEAAQTNAHLSTANETLTTIAKNTAPQNNTPKLPKRGSEGGGRFV